MSFSRSFARLEISAAVAVQRSIGRALALGRKAPNIKGKIIPHYFGRRYVRQIENSKFKIQNPRADRQKTIWQFWQNPQGREMPKIVESCIATADLHKGNFDHKILNMANISEYCDLPGFIYDRLHEGRMRFAHFADVLRLNLLKNHGGLWIDSTCYMTGPIPQYIIDQDFFVFMVGNLTHFPYSFMQNFFIRAEKGSFLNDAWHDLCVEYWKNEAKDIDYFQHQLMFKALVQKNAEAKKLFSEMPKVSEDEVLQFVDTLFDPFDQNEWERIKNLSFMQKTSYRGPRRPVANPADFPGSFFESLCGKTDSRKGGNPTRA